jgi:hypothetical protein
MSIDLDSDLGDRTPPWLELESVKKMTLVEKITSLSAETIRRVYPEYVVKLSPRRDGMKLKHALAIANGTIRRDSG